MNVLLIVAASLIFLIVIIVIILYNHLVKLKKRVETARADIDAILKKRHDLIPRLVETTKGYAKFESSVLEATTIARNPSKADETAIADTLSGLIALVESYPDLKASENFQKLHEELVSVENELSSSRRYYNAVVRDFNIGIQKFPNNIVAGIFRYHEESFFEVPLSSERTAPEVQGLK